jgi:4-hydroxybutyrate CoA-transferase
MSWHKEYEAKKLTAKEAALKIPSHSRVVFGHAASSPVDVVKAMTEQKEHFQDVEIVHMLSLGKGEYMDENMAPYFRHNALFVGGNSRKAIGRGQADFTPCFFNEVPKLFREGILPVDVALVQVSAPDHHGYCSFGLSADYTKPAAECAKIVIAEVNDQMPRVLGDNFIHISEIDYVVETSNPLHEIPKPVIGDVERAIGENCAHLVEDGSTLQLGIGAIPDAVLLFLKDKKDLGIHTEMFSDGVLELVKSGVINNSKKTLHKGKMISTFLMGSKDLYEFVDNNPSVALYPVDYVNHPAVIMQNDNLVSINSCIQVDFMGQVAAESIGLAQFSGVGGQVDYVRGASMAKNGKSIIAMPSTASGGKVSRIVPLLTEGSAVTTSRNDVHYVVTEYGVANLKGKTLKQRAEALIQIAHPDFRAELEKAFKERFNN